MTNAWKESIKNKIEKHSYQTKHVQGHCFPYIHKPRRVGQYQRYIHTILLDWDGTKQKLYQSHSQILYSLGMILKRVASQQYGYRLIKSPTQIKKYKIFSFLVIKLSINRMQERINNIPNTLYTEPNPPCPILFAALKLLHAVLICLYVNKPICGFCPRSSG